MQSAQASTCSSASSSPASPGTSPPPPPPPAALSPPPELLRPATAAPFLGWPDVVDADVTGVVLPPPTACPGGDLTPRATLRRSMRGGNMPCSRASRRLAGLPAHGRAETHAGRVKQGGREAALQGNVFVWGGAPRRGMHIDTACPPPAPTFHDCLERHAYADTELVDVGDPRAQQRGEQRGEDRKPAHLPHIILGMREREGEG